MANFNKYCERFELCREDKPCQKQCELCYNWETRPKKNKIMKLNEEFSEIIICIEIEGCSKQSDDCVKIADKYAINFADWCNSLINRVGLLEWKSNWSSYDTKELLEIYKKEKGL